MELIVSLVILSAALILIMGMVPAGVSGLRKADDVESATLYGMEVVEETARSGIKPFPSDIEVHARLNQTDFTVRREVIVIDTAARQPSLFDIAVTLTWAGQPTPVRLRTRVYRP